MSFAFLFIEFYKESLDEIKGFEAWKHNHRTFAHIGNQV